MFVVVFEYDSYCDKAPKQRSGIAQPNQYMVYGAFLPDSKNEQPQHKYVCIYIISIFQEVLTSKSKSWEKSESTDVIGGTVRVFFYCQFPVENKDHLIIYHILPQYECSHLC